MTLRGERFEIDFSDDEAPARGTGILPSSFVGDILERPVSAAKPPAPPKMKVTATGFPEPRKRKVSAFKKQRAGNASDTQAAPPAQISTPTNPTSLTEDESYEDAERRRIDEENSKRLAQMSTDEINHERQELLAGLNPSLIERLLKRANLDDGRGDTGTEPPAELTQKLETQKASETKEPNKTQKKVTFDDKHEAQKTPETRDPEATPVPQPTGKPVAAQKTVKFEDDEPEQPIDLQPASSKRQPIELEQPAIHFPAAPAPPELDPSDPEFLESLHQKYFPNLPADPSKLAWMAPLPSHGSVADQDSPYYPNQEALPASALRFDFRGGLLPPRISRAMPSTKGLHHHGEAPEAAGYTVPELARLARSAFPAQRCIAFQTLGRLLYRLGRGEWGDQGSEMVMGLWRCMDEGKVIETLESAANAEGGHQGSKVYAIEAVWLWQKGGGQVWKAG
jgi:hypothetical protein